MNELDRPPDAIYFGGLGGFGGLSGFGFEPFGFSAFGSGGGGGDSTVGGAGSTAGGGGPGVERGAGAGFGFGAAFFASFFAGVDAAGLVDFAFVAFGDVAGSAFVASACVDTIGTSASSRGARVVGTRTVVSVTATGSGSRSTAAMKPVPGVEGAGPGGVASNPRTPPMAKPTKMPTIDWIDFESIGWASRMTRGTAPDYPYLYQSAPDARAAALDCT